VALYLCEKQAQVVKTSDFNKIVVEIRSFYN